MSAPRSQRSDTLDQSSSSLHPPSTPSRQQSYHDASNLSGLSAGPNPTHAAFSPATLSSTTPSTTSAAKRRSTILVHQKSPLLLATPPQITRALAYSHPFILLLNKLAGLLSWTTGDPWESFLLLVVFWATVLYGDVVIRVAGPVVVVLMLIGGMYGRRFSPLSSSGRGEPGLGYGEGSSLGAGDGKSGKNGKSGKRLTRHKNLSVDGIPEKPAAGNGPGGVGGLGGSKSANAGGHQRSHSANIHVAEVTNTRHQKTLDEIVETLKEFTTRCNLLLEPLLELTDFLSTQRTPTSATTRPALTALLVRILLFTPVWFALTLPPLRVVTTRRVVLVVGTVALSWHARVVRVGRAILWRSASVRKILGAVTGLQAELPPTKKQTTAAPATLSTAASSASSTSAGAENGTKKANGAPRESELTRALRRARGGGRDAGVRFTFIIFENQRRWVGLGWTNSLFAYERSAWTDERNNAVPPRRQFELPEVEDGNNGMVWRWVEGSRWRVDGVPDEAVAGTADEDDNQGEWDYDGPGGRMGWVYYDNKVCFPACWSPNPNATGCREERVLIWVLENSGKMDDVVKMAGADGRDAANGTVMQNSSRWTIATTMPPTIPPRAAVTIRQQPRRKNEIAKTRRRPRPRPRGQRHQLRRRPPSQPLPLSGRPPFENHRPRRPR